MDTNNNKDDLIWLSPSDDTKLDTIIALLTEIRDALRPRSGQLKYFERELCDPFHGEPIIGRSMEDIRAEMKRRKQDCCKDL